MLLIDKPWIYTENYPKCVYIIWKVSDCGVSHVLQKRKQKLRTWTFALILLQMTLNLLSTKSTNRESISVPLNRTDEYFQLTNKNAINAKYAWTNARTGTQFQLVKWLQTPTINLNSTYYVQYAIINYTNAKSRLRHNSIIITWFWHATHNSTESSFKNNA